MADTAPLTVAGKPVRIGDALSRSFSLLGRHPFVFGTLALIFSVPLIGASYLNAFILLQFLSPGFSLLSFYVIYFAVYLLLLFTLSAAVASGTYRSLRGERVTLTGCLRVGLARFFPVLGVTVLSVLAIGAGFLLLIIPGFIVMTWFYVVVPVVVIERRGLVDALRRSRDLTRGSRLAIFGLLVILTLFDKLSGMAIQIFTVGALGGGFFTLGFYLVLTVAASAFYFALSTLLPAVVYFKLRRAKEGLDVSDIAAVFD